MTDHFEYILHLADNALILGQRNSEWCGHGPVLEQDIAITNISLDLIGQARNLLQHAATIYNNTEKKELFESLLPRPWKNYGRALNEDDLAFLREENQYRNVLLNELPKGDWAVTILKQFFFSTYQLLLFTHLQQSEDKQLAAIAEKSVKEVTYHVRWSSEWVIRLGDGTNESHERIIKAFDQLWDYTQELFIAAPYELNATATKIAVNPSILEEGWRMRVKEVVLAANIPSEMLSVKKWSQTGGKKGAHTEHLGYMLTDMQYLQRAYPNSEW